MDATRIGMRARLTGWLALVVCSALNACAGDDTDGAPPEGPDAGDASLSVEASAADANGASDARDATGDGSPSDAGDSGVEASALTGVVAIAGSPTTVGAGSTSFCARLIDGSVRCWGSDGYGQTGTGAPMTPFVTSRPAEPIGLSSGVTLIAVGDRHAAATQGGSTFVWGDDTSGELGNGSNTAAYVPTAVVSLAGATALSLGGEAGCAVIGGAVQCWGANTFGNVGNGATVMQSSPAATGVSGGSVAVSQHTCAIATGGGVSCWGRDDFGQIGRTSTTTCTSATVPCDPTPGATSITAGASQIAVGGTFSCALLAGLASDAGSASIQCWGDNTTGALGLGTVDANVHAAPAPVALLPSGTTPTAIAAGGEFLCVLLASGAVECWGDDTMGQLGNDRVPQASSVPVIAVTGGAVAIAAGAKTACALMSDTTVECWGANDQGQLGIGSSDTSLHPPTTVR